MKDRGSDVLRLCEGALARPSAEREAYLAEACGGDADLRAAVEAVLAQQSATDGFLQAPAWSPEPPRLASGTRLGPYEIDDFIGAGGMGQVYKARDTRLNRTVAIKILPPAVAGEPALRARFDQEAKTIAALSHPHICPLFDVGDHDGTLFLVMEHLAGETLAERLRKGRLPLGQALTIATHIADALSAAHRQGVVHRDLKPGNVMLTKSGAKLLDFGLAKLHGRRPALAVAAASALPTQEPVTGAGTVLGTVPYMAPEQLQGKETDARSDLFSFGAVLYEMLTNKRPFEGETQASLAAAILERDPPWPASLQPLTPPGLDRLVRRCLAKSPDDRPDSAHDVASDLRWVQEQASAIATTPRKWRLATAVVATCAFTAMLLVAFDDWTVRHRPLAPARPIHATIQIERPPVAWVGQYARLALSPDGQTLVMGEGGGLVRRPLDGDSNTVLTPGTDLYPAFSPGGDSLAFFNESGHIRRVAATGGPIAEVVAAAVTCGIWWGEDDHLYYGSSFGGGGIWRVAVGGGRPEQVSRIDASAGETAHCWPQLLGGSHALLFTALGPSGGSVDSRLVVQPVGTQEHQTLADSAIFGLYVDSGHLLYAQNDGTIYGTPFDSAAHKRTGPTAPVLSGVGTATWGGQAFFTVSGNGTLAFVPRTTRPERVFRIVDARGTETAGSAAFGAALLKAAPFLHAPRPSPRGGLYAVTAKSPGVCDIWLLDARTNQVERVTLDPAEDEDAVWDAKGSAIAYTSASTGTARRIYVKAIGAGAEPELRGTWPRHAHITSWSPDGRWLALEDFPYTGAGADLWLFAVDGSGAKPIANGPAAERNARFSPDGKWIAYSVEESGRTAVWVASVSHPTSRRQVSAAGGWPAWSEDGTTLYYLAGKAPERYLYGQQVLPGAEFKKGRTVQLFATRALWYDVLPGGGFVLEEGNQAPPEAPLHLILNWFEDLKAKAPALK